MLLFKHQLLTIFAIKNHNKLCSTISLVFMVLWLSVSKICMPADLFWPLNALFQHTLVIFCLLEIQSARFKFIHVLNFPLFVSMGMFYNDFGTMETKDKIESHHMSHSSGSL